LRTRVRNPPTPPYNTKQKQTIMTVLLVGVMIFGLLVAIISAFYITYSDYKRGINKVMLISVFKNVKKISKKKIRDLAKNYSEN